MDFSNMFPYNQITPVTVDGQSMVKIPKIYVRNTTPTSGAYNGKYCREISDYAETGFRVHPAFMSGGVAKDYKHFSSYLASQGSDGKPESKSGATPWTGFTYTTLQSKANLRNTGTGEQAGWSIYDIYDHSLLGLLMLLEFGTTDVTSRIGQSNISYREIYDPWGNDAQTLLDLPGIYYDSSYKIYLFDNQGNKTYIDTGIVWTYNGQMGYGVDTYKNSGTSFNLSDIFFPNNYNASYLNGTFSSYYSIITTAPARFLTYNRIYTDGRNLYNIFGLATRGNTQAAGSFRLTHFPS